MWLLTLLLVSAVVAVEAPAATKVRTYSPIDEDGTLRDGLVVERGGTRAECDSESYVAYQAVRCFAGSFIRDPCFIDTRKDEPAVLCISSPWSHVALAYDVLDDMPEPSTADNTPWALVLASGSRCTFVSGGTLAIGNFRLNYFCRRTKSHRRPAALYGSPNRKRLTWTIRAVRTVRSRRLYRVPIRAAWR